MDNKNNNKLQIRNSTAEFLIFTKNATGETIEVRLQRDAIWLTQKLISALRDNLCKICTSSNRRE